MLTAITLFALMQSQATADPISAQMGALRGMAPEARAKATGELALAIRKLPASEKKLGYASALSNLATEGDCGDKNLQEVADTLVEALRETPTSQPFAYQTLANYARYEGIKVNLSAPAYTAALADLVRMEKERAKVDFTLKDLTGKSWTLSQLKGKVVVVNFWATWCPPCRGEMPDLQVLSKELAPKGLVVLAISDEKADVVRPFIKKNGYTFPILLDEGRAVNTKYKIQGIPNSFVYDRSGKLVAVGIDGRTRRQFLKLLAKAGITP